MNAGAADIFSKFAGIVARRAEILASAGGEPLGVRMDEFLSPTEVMIEGRRCTLMGSNNYLGLTFDADCMAASQAAIAAAGTGTTGSRVANGSYGAHIDLERQLAAYYGCKHALLFTTGYQANVGFLSAIVGKDDYILIDAECHASIYDGCKLGHATVLHFKHNDAADLERRLARLPADDVKLVVTEGIFSMSGDCAPLAAIVESAKRHGAYIMVDEAHSLGVLGETGRGLVEELGLAAEVDFILGTFSKSVGTIGGFCVSNHAGLELLRFAARSYIFTASLPPAIVASASTAIEKIRTRPDLRQRLWRNADIMYDGLQALGYRVGAQKTPVIGIRMPDLADGLRIWRELVENGVYVNLVLPPATPSGSCLLRCSVSAAHTAAQLQAVLDAFRRVQAGSGASAKTAAAV